VNANEDDALALTAVPYRSAVGVGPWWKRIGSYRLGDPPQVIVVRTPWPVPLWTATFFAFPMVMFVILWRAEDTFSMGFAAAAAVIWSYGWLTLRIRFLVTPSAVEIRSRLFQRTVRSEEIAQLRLIKVWGSGNWRAPPGNVGWRRCGLELVMGDGGIVRLASATRWVLDVQYPPFYADVSEMLGLPIVVWTRN